MSKLSSKNSELQEKKCEENYQISKLYKDKVIVRFYPKSHQYWVSINGSPFKRKTGSTTAISIKDKSTALMNWQQTMTLDFLLGLIDKKIPINEDLAIEAVIQNDIKKEEAVDIGIAMHDWLDLYAQYKMKKLKEFPPMPEIKEAITGINAFLEWEGEHKVKYISSERMVYSLKHDYMGTLDLEASVDGLHCLVDYKSSNGLYNSVRMQTASYIEADEEERKVKVYKGRWALRFSKYTEAEYIKREQRKKVLKAHIARIKGKEYKDTPIAPYQSFEAKFLDKNKGMMADDMDAFLHAKELYQWDRRTDWYYNPEY